MIPDPACIPLSSIRVDSSNLRAVIDGVDYQWVGGFGAILKSWERDVKKGDIRMIGNVIFFAYIVRPYKWWSREVCWTVADPKSEFIRHFKHQVFA